ncbi:MAG: ABC transporter substrate-binding protein [Chloroflexota bacterium]
MQTRTLFTMVGRLVVLALLLASCTPAAAPTPTPKAAPPAKAAATATAAPKAAAPTAAAKPPAPTSAAKPAAPTPKPAAPTPSPKPTGEQARHGGILTASSQSEPPSLDPHQEPTINTAVLVAPCYNNLTEFDAPTGKKIVPALAESWELSPDGKLYTFTMRKGVKWHDGKPFTVADALLSLQRLTDPPKGVRSNIAFMLQPVVDKVESPNADTLKVTLSKAFAPFLPCISFAYTVILPKHILETKGNMKETAVGTGPFKLESYDAGVSFKTVKNKDYWVKDRPYLDGVTFFIIKDPATRLSALRTGRVLMTGRYAAALNPNEVDAIQKAEPRIKAFVEPSKGAAWFCMHNKKPPFSDVRMRRAISLVHDRQAAVQVLAQGKGTIGTVMPFEGWGLEESELLKFPGFKQPKDAAIAEAKKLMAEAGYGQGLKLTVHARTRRTSKDPALFIANELTKIGIQAEVKVEEDTAFWDRARRGAFEACVYQPALALPDPEWMSRYYIPGGALNYARNEDDKKLIDLWQSQQQMVDIKKRQEVTKEVERYLLTEAIPGVLIVWFNTFCAHWEHVKGVAPGVSSYANIGLQEVWLAR